MRTRKGLLGLINVCRLTKSCHINVLGSWKSVPEGTALFPNQEMQLDEIATGTVRFQNFVKESRLSPQSKRAYLTRFESFRKFMGENETIPRARCIDELSQALTGYQKYLKQNLELKGCSVNRYMNTAKQFISFLGVSPPSVQSLQEEPAVPKLLNLEEQDMLLESVASTASPRDRSLIQLMLLAGLRPAECSELKRKHLLFQANRLFLFIEHEYKSRTIPAPPLLEGELLRYLRQRKSICDSAEVLFRTGTGKTLAPNTLDRIIRRSEER
ncbi:MAG: tyrosine-type recombinase/integrase, partial [Cyanobacteria bacterium]|nr:tyrosine-type recombinase/integrase [Cyanobacteriota bacterium]